MKSNKQSSCNVTNQESYTRLFLSFLMLSLGITYSLPMVYIMALYMGYTAVRKYCYLNHVFNINKLFSTENKLLANLPTHNPEPVFIINSSNEIIYKNDPANELFPDTKDFSFLCSVESVDEIINDEKLVRLNYKFNENKVYLFALQGSKEMNSILIYGANVTSAVLAEAEVINTQKEIVYAMGEIGETRSKETGNHVKRVAKYSKLMAQLYGLNQKDIDTLTMASPMHDIGKVAIPDAILNKPGKFTPEEFEIMKEHAVLGYKMLKNSNKDILKAAAIVSHEHHEKWDGSGYPRNLKEDEIHIFGRITAIADVFDALGSDRVYKKAWELNKILDLFKDQSGKHFDPNLIKLFLDNLDDFLEIRDKYQD